MAAQGLEPDCGANPNRAIPHDFGPIGLGAHQLLPPHVDPSISPSLLDSPRVVETWWRRADRFPAPTVLPEGSSV